MVHDAGAYCMSMASTYNLKMRPTEYWVKHFVYRCTGHEIGLNGYQIVVVRDSYAFCRLKMMDQ